VGEFEDLELGSSDHTASLTFSAEIQKMASAGSFVNPRVSLIFDLFSLCSTWRGLGRDSPRPESQRVGPCKSLECLLARRNRCRI
jgi:hypothetical protein